MVYSISRSFQPAWAALASRSFPNIIGRSVTHLQAGPHRMSGALSPEQAARFSRFAAELSMALQEEVIRRADAREFHEAIEAAKRYGKAMDQARHSYGTEVSQWRGAYVHTYSVEEYQKTKRFLTANRLAGFAIDDDAVISLFKHPADRRRGVADLLLPRAIQEGGRRLDCFSGVLPNIYVMHDFFPVARVNFNREFAPDDWNYVRDGEPDIIFMVHNPEAFQGVAKDKGLRGAFIGKEIERLPYSTYDEGVAACKNFITQNRPQQRFRKCCSTKDSLPWILAWVDRYLGGCMHITASD